MTRDRRDLPSYGLIEAASALALPASTVRVWCVGMRYRLRDQPRFMRPLIVPAERSPLTLSFWNLVEVYVLATIRRKYSVSMPTVRRALSYVSREMNRQRPLIEEDFLTDGVDLFIERFGHLVIASAGGQEVIGNTLRESLKRIVRDEQGFPLRVYPWLSEPGTEPRLVEIDPFRAAGRLVIAETGIPTEAVAERFRAGESVDDLASDYGLGRDKIETAIRWEQCAAIAA